MIILTLVGEGKLSQQGVYTIFLITCGYNRRICPAIHLAEVEMFVGLIEILSRCTIEPTAKDGLPDINGARHGGISILPLPYKVKFTKRDIPLVNISDLADPSLSHL